MNFLLNILPDPNSSQTVGWLCLALFGIAGGINHVLAIWDRTKEIPPPAQTYVTKPDCLSARIELNQRMGRLDSDLHDIRSEMKADRETLLLAGEERAMKIHQRIDAVLAAVSELKGRVQRRP